MSRYSLTALGMVNALGASLPEIAGRLFHGAPDRLTPHRLRTTGAVVLVGQVQEPLSALPAHLGQYQCRNHALAYCAYQQIEVAVASLRERFGPARIGVVVGSSTSGIDASEVAFFHWRAEGKLPEDYCYQGQHEMGSVAEFLARLAEVTGPSYTLSTACSSSAKVFASAQALLDLDCCDAVIVGGVDTLCHLTLNGFEALISLSRTVSNPSSRNRDGLNIGEGAALFLLSREAGPVQLLGVGESSDAHHISAPDPAGTGAEAAIRMALAEAGLAPGDIHYVNLHGTGTPQNDAMEAGTIQRLFGAVPASSTKPLVGHCLGASGAIEAGFCWLALQAATPARVPLLPHHWDGVVDERMPELNLVRPGTELERTGPIHFLSNSFAFGGSNCAVILGRDASPTTASTAQPTADLETILRLRNWAAWAPGLTDRAAWEQWLRTGGVVEDTGVNPPCAGVHPMIRRRCGRLVRMVLEVAFQVCQSSGVDPARVHHVHCSRHGEIATMRQLFDSLFAGTPLSPALFSSSVHHTPTAYFDLAAKNTLLSRTLSAGESALACAILEVSGLLRKYPAVPVLLTFGDEPPPEPFRAEGGAPQFPNAVAFLFEAQPTAANVPLHFRRASVADAPPALPRDVVLEFLRWLAGDAAQFQLPANFGGWLCRR